LEDGVVGLGVIKEIDDFLRPLKKRNFGDLEDLLPGLNTELGRTTMPNRRGSVDE